MKPLKEWLDHCVDNDIYEKVPDSEPITWCSPLVVQPKPRFAQTKTNELKPHMIRASIDLRIPNKYMERNRIAQNTIVEDFTYKFHGCRVYSKLDMTMGYHQLMLHPASRAIATFSTPWGNMRPKRLIFGAKSSQDAFDEVIYRIFGDIDGCLNQRDDILIGAETRDEHDQILERVLRRAADYGITFSREKCQFGMTDIDFYGYKFSGEGLKPSEDKIKAVREADRPKDKTAVKSFLGMIGYLSKFIPNYATMTAPLRVLTRKDTEFKWGSHEQRAFDKLKQSITEDTTLCYFSPKLPIVVRTEASYKEGIAAALFQKTHKGLQPVHFVSRSLSDVEKRYSQTEKDALAVKWGKERLSMYLLGAPRFQIVTSHKPLIPMFNKPTAQLPPRIEKCVMALQDVDYEMVYEPGKDERDPLDYLSRHPLPETGSDSIEKTIAAVIQTNHAIVLEDIARATKNDLQLQKIMRCMRLHLWEQHRRDQDIAPFYPVRTELYEANGILMRMDKIILPDKLRFKSVKAAHKLGHLGITKTKQLLRQKYWFPELNHLVEETIGKCYECRVVTDNHVKEPTKTVPIPREVWGEISADFGGPYPDGHYNLVLIDKRSRYPAVEIVHSTSFKATRRAMKKIFSDLGTPRRICTDNGPPFNSNDFSEFALEEGFEHHRVTPLHPQTNGEAESFMRLLNKMERIAHLQQRDYHLALSDLLTGYRATPHPATGVAPYDMITNRRLRTKLCDSYLEQTEKDIEITQRDTNYKARYKRHDNGRSTKPHKFSVGDLVLVKQRKQTKLSTPFEPTPYNIIGISGTQMKIQRTTDGRCITRHADQLKSAGHPLEEDGQVAPPRDYNLPVSNECDMPTAEHEPSNLDASPSDTGQSTPQNSNHDYQETDQATELPGGDEPVVQQLPPPTPRQSNRRRMTPRYLSEYIT